MKLHHVLVVSLCDRTEFSQVFCEIAVNTPSLQIWQLRCYMVIKPKGTQLLNGELGIGT